MRIATVLFILWSLASLTAHGASVPASTRSRKAVENITPHLRSTLSERGLSLGDEVFIRIFKAESALEIWIDGADGFTLFRTYPICTFSGEPGPKLAEGDQQAPEGFYFVTPARMNPTSRFHLSFNLGYPNAYDRSHNRTGSALMVHGSCVSIGCYAMTDAGIEEIWTLMDAALRAGQPFIRVHAFPFRMTTDQLVARASSEWADFWNNLAEGYRYFEEHRVPPNVEVRHGRYVFEPPSR